MALCPHVRSLVQDGRHAEMVLLHDTQLPCVCVALCAVVLHLADRLALRCTVLWLVILCSITQ